MLGKTRLKHNQVEKRHNRNIKYNPCYFILRHIDSNKTRHP